MDAAERVLLDETMRAALTDARGDGGAPADGVLAGLGWLELLEAEPDAAVEIVFGALGTTNRTATALDDVMISALGATPRADLAVLLPPFGAWHAPGRSNGGDAHALGLTTARVLDATEVLVACADGSAVGTVAVPISSVDMRAVEGIDPGAGLHVVRVEHAAPAAAAPLDPDAWESAVALGRRAVAHQIAGASRTMLTLARAHATERVQFGRRIAGFQAVRHRLAEALVAVEALDATLRAAGDEPNGLTAALAKATAGRTARTVAAHCQQVLAGIGFTTDHPFHRYLKRTMLLDGLLGSADEIAIDVGRQLIALRQVPTLVEL
jgi:hypothetical protein